MAKDGKTGRAAQIIQAYRLTKKADRWLGWILLGTFLFAGAAGFALFTLIPPGWLIADIILGLMVGLLVALIVFGRRATKSQVKQIEGQPGAAVAVLSMLKRGWKSDPAIAFNKQQDVVHRLVGPPGIVLIGEGNPQRLKNLLSSERAKHQRYASEAPIHEVIVGYGEGEVPLGKLTRHVTKLGRQVKPAEVTDILYRLQGDGREPLEHPDPQGSGADQHEGLPRQHAGPLTSPGPRSPLVHDAARTKPVRRGARTAGMIPRPTVAVVGAGISGLSAAYALQRTHDVTLFEAEPRLGGHAHTHDVPVGSGTVPVDSGFIVLNDRTYPRLRRLFSELDRWPVRANRGGWTASIGSAPPSARYGTRRWRSASRIRTRSTWSTPRFVRLPGSS